MSRFAAALRRGMSLAARYTCEPVTYRRGTATVGVNASRGEKQAIEVDTGDGSRVETLYVDWILEADEIAQSAGPISPIDGDTITDADGVEYRVTKHPSDGKASRWMPQRVAMRIHTVIVSGE